MVHSRSLPERLRELGLIKPELLEEIAARELIFGGDFVLNALELGAVPEARLLEVVAEVANLPAHEGHHQLHASLTERVLEQGLRGLARDLGDYIVLTVGRRLDATQIRNLEETLDRELRLEIALAPRIEEALSKGLGISLAPRLGDLLLRIGEGNVELLDDTSILAPKFADPPPTPLVEVRAESSKDAPFPSPGRMQPESPEVAQLDEHGLTLDAGITAPPPEGYERYTLSAARDVLPAELAERRRQHARFIKEVSHSLLRARERDEVLEILLDAASEYFEFTVLFTVTGTEAKLHAARGPGASELGSPPIRIPLDLPSSYRKVVSTCVHQLARLKASGLEGGIVEDLRRPRGLRALLLPVMIRGRTVLLLQGDRGEEEIDLAEVSPVLDLAPAAGQALERVLLERKRQSLLPSAISQGEVLQRLAKSDAPPAVESRATESQTAGSDSVASDSAASDSVASDSAASDSVARPVSQLVTTPAPGPEVPPAFEVPPREATLPEEAPQAPDLDYSLPPSIGDRHVPTARGIPEHGSIPPADFAQTERVAEASPHEVVEAAPRKFATRSDFPTDHVKTLPGLSPFPPAAAIPKAEPALPIAPSPSEVPPPPEAVVRPARAPQSSLVPRRMVPVVSRPAAISDLGTVGASHGLEVRPTGTLVSRRPILSGPPVDDWDSPKPSPVASVARGPRDYGALVDEYVAGKTNALELLLDGGESAIASLVARFPGPVKEPKDARTRASECGPLLHALVRFGIKATPFITVRTADENPLVRRYATHLLGELPSRESARAVAERLLDSSLEVRRAALTSARLLQSDPVSRRTVRADLEELAVDRKQHQESRCAAIEALADIREQEAIPTLLQLFNETERSVVRAAIWALCVLTRHDFGQNVARWREFWQEHRDTPRVEWLILALGQDNADLRRAAAEELNAMSGLQVRLNDEASEGDRRAAQAEVRRWLQENGSGPRA